MVHKALVIEKVGQPAVLVDRPTPEPKEDEVLIKVSIAGLNPHDGYGKAFGLFINDSLPTPIGIDIVGTVVKLGPNVSKFKVGDEIMAFGDAVSPNGTATQEYCLVASWQAALIPSNVTADEAATFPLNAMTLVFALFHETGLGLPPPFGDKPHGFDYASQSLVIIGGGSATGKFGIELARIAGFKDVVVVASKSNESQLKALGATAVIDRHQTDDEIDTQVRAIVGDTLLYAVDCVSGTKDGQTLGARVLSNTQKGKLVVLVHAGGVDEAKIGPKNAGWERKPIVCMTRIYPDIGKAFWRALPEYIEQGKLKPTTYRVIEGLDAEEVNNALDAYAGGLGIVKPHLHIK